MTKQLQRAYDHFNARLFGASLPRLPIKIERIPGGGLGCFTTKGGAHEITISPEVLQRSDEDILSTLVHEMAHYWDELHGDPAPGDLHGDAWTAKMRAIGLQPYGLRGQVSHTIARDGAFTRAYTKLQASGWQLQGPPPVAFPARGPHGQTRPIRHLLRPPLPPAPPAPTLAGQLCSGFETLGLLISGSFHLGPAAVALWLSFSIMNPILSRWFSSWGDGSAWLKHLLHLLFT